MILWRRNGAMADWMDELMCEISVKWPATSLHLDPSYWIKMESIYLNSMLIIYSLFFCFEWMISEASQSPYRLLLLLWLLCSHKIWMKKHWNLKCLQMTCRFTNNNNDSLFLYCSLFVKPTGIPSHAIKINKWYQKGMFFLFCLLLVVTAFCYM